MPLDKSPCGLLAGFTNSPVRDLQPLEYLTDFATFAHAGRTHHIKTIPSKVIREVGAFDETLAVANR